MRALLGRCAVLAAVAGVFGAGSQAEAAIAKALGIKPKVNTRVTSISSAAIKKQIVTADPVGVESGQITLVYSTLDVTRDTAPAAVGTYNILAWTEVPFDATNNAIIVQFDNATPPPDQADIFRVEFTVNPAVPDNQPITYSLPQVDPDGNSAINLNLVEVAAGPGTPTGGTTTYSGTDVQTVGSVAPYRAPVFGLRGSADFGNDIPAKMALTGNSSHEYTSPVVTIQSDDVTGKGQAGAIQLDNLGADAATLGFLIDITGPADLSALIAQLNALPGVTAYTADHYSGGLPTTPGAIGLSPSALPGQSWDIALLLDPGVLPTSPFLNWQFDPSTAIELNAIAAVPASAIGVPEPAGLAVIGVMAMACRRRSGERRRV